jgi:hypothetical protein
MSAAKRVERLRELWRLGVLGEIVRREIGDLSGGFHEADATTRTARLTDPR